MQNVFQHNQGTLAGNLMLKNAHNDFPSDVFLTLATVGAILEVIGPTGALEQVAMADLPTHNMDRKLIARIKLPELAETGGRVSTEIFRYFYKKFSRKFVVLKSMEIFLFTF